MCAPSALLPVLITQISKSKIIAANLRFLFSSQDQCYASCQNTELHTFEFYDKNPNQGKSPKKKHYHNKFSNCVLRLITAQHRNLGDTWTQSGFRWRRWKGRNHLYNASFFTFEKLLLTNYKLLFPFKEDYAQWSSLGPKSFGRLFHFLI